MIICGIQRCNSNNSVFAFTYLPRFPSGYCQLGCTARTVTLMQFISSLMFSKLYLNSSSRSKKRKSKFEPEQKFKIYPEKKRIKKSSRPILESELRSSSLNQALKSHKYLSRNRFSRKKKLIKKIPSPQNTRQRIVSSVIKRRNICCLNYSPKNFVLPK